MAPGGPSPSAGRPQGGTAGPLPSLTDLATGYADRSFSPEVAAELYLRRIAAHERTYNCFVRVDAEGAMAAARASAQRWREGRPRSAIDGVPISVKDMFAVAGLPMRCGSLTTPDEPSAEDSPAVLRLRNAGAVILGITTTAEYGGAPVTISPLTGVTRNAWNPARTAGGSSGGAAVAVAAGFCAGALASDTGGSIRIPAAFNGVVGLKPTGGRIPTDPASVLRTLGCPGPMARSVADCALLYAALADRALGADDPASPDPAPAPAIRLEDIRFAASRRLGYAAFLDAEVDAAFTALIARLRGLGCAVDEMEPDLADPVGIFQAYTRANYASILGHLGDGDVARLSPNVREARAAGGSLGAVDLLAARRARQAFAQRMETALGPYDILLTPMTAVPPFAAEAFVPDHPAVAGNPRAWSPFGYPFNLTGQPAITLPCGLTADGLPIACQLVAARWGEALLLKVAEAVERAIGFAASPTLVTTEAAHA